MQQIKAFFNRMYFGNTLPFNYRIYMIFFFECFLLSIVSATTNTLLHKGLPGIVFQWAFIAYCVVVLLLPVRWRIAVTKPTLLFVAYLYIPFLFFQTAGYHGTAALFSLLGLFLLAIVFYGRQRVLLIAANIMLWMAICVLQFRYPQLVVAHGSEQAKLIDYLVAMSLSGIGIALLGVYVRDTYQEEQRRIHGLLKSEEENNRQLEKLSNADALTGAYNRRFLTQYFAREQEARKRSVMMLDIDHFKQVNDTWGHSFGDEVLIRFAAAVQENLRKNDVLARTGGEEFVVVLAGMELERAYEIAERIRSAIEDMLFSNDVHITVSIGLVQAHLGEGIDSLLRRADKCLYSAKRAGRNRVVYSN